MKTYIFEWLDNFNMTEEKLSEKTKIPQSMIVKWRLGKSTPSLAQLDLLSKELDVSIDQLVYVDPNKVHIFTGNGEELLTQEEPKDVPKFSDPGKTFIVTLPLQQWLDEKGMTITDICGKTGIPGDVVGSWIRNETNPSLLQTAALAEILQISIDELLLGPVKEVPKKDTVHAFEFVSVKPALRFTRYLTRKNLDYMLDYSTEFDPTERKDRIYIMIVYTGDKLPVWKILFESMNPKNKTDIEERKLEDILAYMRDQGDNHDQ